MDAQDSKFEAGQKLGDCLIKGCVVFTGTIQSLGNLEKEPDEDDPERAVMLRKVTLKVDEWLHGKRNGDTVPLLYAQRPQMTKTGIGPWTAWEGVNLQVGGQVLVARWAESAPRPKWRGKPDDVAWVSSDRGLFAPVRAAITEHQRFERDRREADKIPQLLRGKPDSLVVGYVITYLLQGLSTRDVDKAAIMASGLIAHSAVPGSGREAISEWIGSSFYRLTDASRKAVTESLVAAASADDPAVANPALDAMVTVADRQLLDLKPHLTEARRKKIVAHYEKVRAQKPGLESQLGMR
jgi:hypothetical protein